MYLRSILSLLTVSVLSGCLVSEPTRFVAQSGVDKSFPYSWNCAADQEKTAKDANWKTAIVVEETIKDEIYQLGLLTLQVGKPHIIKIVNEDDTTRSFRAPVLFGKSSILKVIHEGKEVVAPCLKAVAVSAKKTSEIHLVPLETGYFDYHETFLVAPMLTEITTNGAVGLAYVY